MRTRWFLRCWAWLSCFGALLFAPGAASAQELWPQPIVLGGGRVTLGGEASLTVSCADPPGPVLCGPDTGFFNYSDYEHSALRMLRLDLNASFQANRRVTVLADVRSENGESPRPYALYVRIRPWIHRAFDIQVGRVPPAFGAFPRRAYGRDRLLIGYPLSYQYLTSIRPDAIPANADDVLRMRGRGWLSSFPLGNQVPNHGLPLATAFRWDTGVEVHAAGSWVDATAAITTGSLANPLVGDDNSGKQVAGRIAVHPVPGLLVGVSAARAPFLTRAAVSSAGAESRSGDLVQAAMGFDAEYSRDYYLVRMETVMSDWTLPTLAEPLRALATFVEGRYKVHPRLYAAARFDDLGFSRISSGARTAEWEAALHRLEIGGGYLLYRNLQLKASWQHNLRQGGRVPELNITSAQLEFWF